MKSDDQNYLRMENQPRLIAGLVVTPLSLASIVLIVLFNPQPVFSLAPLPTLIIGIAMLTLEWRNRIK